MRTMNTSILLILCVICIGGALQRDCHVTQKFVTLGDFFSSRGDESSYFIISAVNVGNGCKSGDVVLRIIDSSGSKLLKLLPTETTYEREQRNYKATGYYFHIPREYGLPLYYWYIETPHAITTTTRMPSGGSRNPENVAKWIVVADMNVSEKSKPLFDKLYTLHSEDYDGLIHIGDFAYDIDNRDGMVGDEYFEEASHASGNRIPYIVSPGNHENYDKGRMFNYRFKMSGGGKPDKRGANYFSYTYKGVHFVTINWDYLFSDKMEHQDDWKEVFDWLKDDLKEARNSPNVNFIVFYSHRPFYCQHVEDCNNFFILRPFEALLRKYKTDLIMTAHVHIYSRLKYNNDFQIFNTPQEGGPLMIVNGAAGVQQLTANEGLTGPFVASGYEGESAWLRLTTTPNSMKGELLNSKTDKVLDSFEITKQRKAILVFE